MRVEGRGKNGGGGRRTGEETGNKKVEKDNGQEGERGKEKREEGGGEGRGREGR